MNFLDTLYQIMLSSTESSSSTKKPYSTLFHPLKTWVDILIGYLVSLLLPLEALSKCPTVDEGETAIAIRKIRETLAKIHPGRIKSSMQNWAKSLGQEIVETTLSIPRRPAILKEWNLHKDDEDLQAKMPKEYIAVSLRMPISVCGKSASLASKGKNEFGCRTLDNIDWDDLPKNVPFIVMFHGGGMTVGSNQDAECMDLVQRTSVEAQKPVIVASVEYSLAPTVVFPAAPAEALTVLSYFIEKMPDRSFHIAGISAGGNLATVAAFELVRRFPDKLASLVASVPMLNPAADSESYYMNLTSSKFAPVPWLRWSWRCYLELPANTDDDKVDIFSLNSLPKRLRHGSNYHTWENSHWRETKLARLACPLLDMPKNLVASSSHSKSTAPPIMVHTNQADPLHCDGVELAQKLRDMGSNVKYIEHGGSHWAGTVGEPKKYQQVIIGWKELMFA